MTGSSAEAAKHGRDGVSQARRASPQLTLFIVFVIVASTTDTVMVIDRLRALPGKSGAVRLFHDKGRQKDDLEVAKEEGITILQL